MKSLGLSDHYREDFGERENIAFWLGGRIRHAELRRGFWYRVSRKAFACGVPVIGSKVDGSREAFLDGQLGRLVDPKVPGELVKAVADVLCNGSFRQRSNLVRCFDVAYFRSRVAEWLMERTTKDQGFGDVGATAAFRAKVDDGSAVAVSLSTDLR